MSKKNKTIVAKKHLKLDIDFSKCDDAIPDLCKEIRERFDNLIIDKIANVLEKDGIKLDKEKFKKALEIYSELKARESMKSE